MITFTAGDLLETEAEALVNSVNCAGVMGRGIALQFKRRFPDNFNAYAAACDRQEIKPGHMFVFETNTLTLPRYIINFPTKRHWRQPSRMRDIELGLQDLVRVIRQYKIASVAVPPLGSGLGGLDWNEVRPRLEQALTLPDVRVFVFEPSGVRRDYQTTQFTPNMTAGKAVLIGLMRQYLASLLDPFVTLLEIHKLMYFLQTSGEPLHLAYRKQKYGPYAENLRHVLAAINGHFISGYVGDDSPFAHIELCPGAVDRAEQFLREHQETRERFNRVSSLVDGFESSFGLELLATVHWVIEQDGACTLSEAVQRTYDWNDRKKQFTPQQIEIAANTLADKGWIRKLQAHVAAD